MPEINQIQEYPQVLQNLYLYRDTLHLVLVLQSLSLSYGSSTCTKEFILVFRILSWYYGEYTCISDFIHVLQNLYMYFRSYTCISEYILVLRILYLFTKLIIILRILFLCEGTRRYDESEQIRIIAHTRSDQTYTDTDISLS